MSPYISSLHAGVASAPLSLPHPTIESQRWVHADKPLIFAIPEMTISYNNNVSKDRKLQLRYLQQFSID
jgi:hypothetical protein